MTRRSISLVPPAGSNSESTAPTREFHESEFKMIPPHGSSGSFTYQAFQAAREYARIIELLYSHPGTPWQTQSDVMRAFLHDGCEKYGEAIGGEIIPGIRHRLKMMNSLVERARDANDFVASIDQLEREVNRMVEGDMRESAVGLVHQYRDEARRMEDRILRRRVMSDISRRFGYLLTGDHGRKAHERRPSMMDVDDEE